MARPRHDVTLDSLASQVAAEGLTKGEHILQVLEAFAQESAPGALLPSERSLAEHFRVSRMTARGAIDALEKRGYARRVAGRGTFVDNPRITHSEVFRSFSDDMRSRGLEPGTTRYRMSVRQATHDVARGLGVEPGSATLRIERVRTADGRPMALERINVSLGLFPGLDKVMTRDQSLYDLIHITYGIRVESSLQRVSIVRVSAADAAMLGVSAQDAAFEIEGTALDNMGRVVEYGRSIYRGDRYAFEMRLTRS